MPNMEQVLSRERTLGDVYQGRYASLGGNGIGLGGCLTMLRTVFLHAW